MAVSDWFKSFSQLKKDKQEYRKYQKRIRQLPEEYRYVFLQIQKYMWSMSNDTTGYKTMGALEDLLETFEDGAANGRNVFDITGDDVGEFAENILKETSGSWQDNQKNKLNKQMDKYRKNK